MVMESEKFTLASIRVMARSNAATDRGHRHASGCSIISIWIFRTGSHIEAKDNDAEETASPAYKRQRLLDRATARPVDLVQKTNDSESTVVQDAPQSHVAMNSAPSPVAANQAVSAETMREQSADLTDRLTEILSANAAWEP